MNVWGAKIKRSMPPLAVFGIFFGFLERYLDESTMENPLMKIDVNRIFEDEATDYSAALTHETISLPNDLTVHCPKTP